MMSYKFFRLFSAGMLLATLSVILPMTVRAADPMPTGTLVRTYSDPKVYYIENGSRRWIETGEAFEGQGFKESSIVFIPDADISAYKEGQPVRRDSLIILPSERDNLPDLLPFAAEDVRIVRKSGRAQLKFTTTFWNRGKSAMELRTNQDVIQGSDATYDAYQRIFNTDGTHRDRSVGTIYWHSPHKHFHYVQFADYHLDLIKADSDSSVSVPSFTQKTTFCLRDDVTVRKEPEGKRQGRTYVGCNGRRQGVSVGWADVYGYFLPDQYFDVTDHPAGLYKITFDIDPVRLFAEGSRENNVSIALIELDPARNYVKVVGFATPFETSWNTYPEAMLVKAVGDSKVYMVNGNRKRWIRSEEVFRSYNRPWSEIYEWPSALISVIPRGALIRQAGTNRVFALNEGGWKRYVLSPEVMASYGSTGADIADISPVEFASYPTTDLVKLEGRDDIYSISGKKRLGTTSEVVAQGHDAASIHAINQIDFNAYGF